MNRNLSRNLCMVVYIPSDDDTKDAPSWKINCKAASSDAGVSFGGGDYGEPLLIRTKQMKVSLVMWE